MFDLFEIGFLSVTFLDLIDISIVAFVIYNLYKLLKGTIASQIFIGLMIILLLSFIAQATNLKAMNMLLKLITDIWIIAFIVLFQPEIRRLLVVLATNPLFTMNFKEDKPSSVQTLVDAAFQLSQLQHGALIILIKSSGMRGFSETGELIDAELSKDLLLSIFYPRSPLHDGAVIINNDKIEAARCALPLSSTAVIDGESLGMRHRAGLGISEQADVLSIIVSEETGGISVAENGELTQGLSKEALRKTLEKVYQHSSTKTIKGIIGNYFK